MSRRSRISLTVDSANMILIARLYSTRDENQEPQDLVDFLNAADSPWLYDFIIDFRRFETELSRDHLLYLTHKWAEMSRGRDHHKCLALITGDYSLKMQLTRLMDAMPPRLISVFKSTDAALDWIATCGDQDLRETG